MVNIDARSASVFKDRLVRGCVKLATIAEGDYSYLRKSRCNWFDAMSTVCTNSPLGKQLRDIVDKDLYKDADAAHFRKLHAPAYTNPYSRSPEYRPMPCCHETRGVNSEIAGERE